MNPFAKNFSVISDGSRHFVVVQVTENTAKRAATMIGEEGETPLVAVIEDALNLHAMPRLLGALRSRG